MRRLNLKPTPITVWGKKTFPGLDRKREIKLQKVFTPDGSFIGIEVKVFGKGYFMKSPEDGLRIGHFIPALDNDLEPQDLTYEILYSNATKNLKEVFYEERSK